MEAVGARLGRSSSRYGTTTVFTGPVRKWKKNWVPIITSSSSSNNSNLLLHSSPLTALANGGSFNGSNNGSLSRLSLFKWTPVSHTTTNNNNNKDRDNSLSNNENENNSVDNGDNSPVKDPNVDDAEPPRKKFKYIPVAVLEKQTKEAEENSDDEDKLADTDENTAEKALKRDGHDEKPDINDIPMEDDGAMEENLMAAGRGRQDLNESLDLSLGWTSHEEGNGSDSQTDPTEDG